MHYSQEALAAKDSKIRQISALAEQVDKPYKLWFGESDQSTPEFICRAAYEAALAGHTFYTPTAGVMPLREAIAKKFHEVHGIEYKPTEVMCSGGGVGAIFYSIRAHVSPGDNVLIMTPGWPVTSSIVAGLGGEAREIPMVETKTGFALDIDRIRKAIDSRTRMLAMCSPSNPTGWVITREEQKAVWALAVKHDFVILSDEVYDRIVFDGPCAPTFAEAATDKDHLIVVNSFSKTYNMTGWRLGYALTSENTVKLMAKIAELVLGNPPAPIQHAAITALRDGEPYVKEIRERYAQNRKLTLERLQQMPNVWVPSVSGAFYAFPKIHGLRDSMEFAKKLLLETRVGMAPGSAFGEAGEGYMRLCFATSESILNPALDRFEDFIKRNVCD